MITRDDCATMNFPPLPERITITSDGLLRVGEVCRLLNVERHTVYKLIECDVLPTIRISERIVRVPAEAVQRILAASDR